MDINKKNPKRKVTIKKLYLFIGLIVVIWILSWIGVNWLYDSGEKRGTFGDQFGAVNALFSGLAFAGLIYTILLQHEELSLQRQELEDTRKELEGQKLEAEKQNSIMLKQQFENTFFQLLQMHHEIVKSWRNELDKKILYGHDAIKECYMTFKRGFRKGCNEVERDVYGDVLGTYCDEAKLVDISFVINYYKFSYQTFVTNGGSYFRNLYGLIEFVDERELLSTKEKYEYIILLRSQLSDFELALLFYSCISKDDSKKLKSLIEKYALFSDLPNGILISEEHREFYEPEAFERVMA